MPVSGDSVPTRSARSLSVVNRIGTGIMRTRVEVIIPPTIGAAIRFMTYELLPFPRSAAQGAGIEASALPNV